MASFLSNLYQFSRPHTIPATMMAIVYQFASVGGFSSSLSSTNASDAYAVLAMSLLKWELVVLFIVGINQIHDVEIDRINKTYLPLASGGFSMATAQLITYGSLVGSVALALYQQDPVSLALVCVCLLIGTAYSVPQLRFKSSQTLAGVSIVLARGLLVNLAEYGIFHRAVHGSDGSHGTSWSSSSAMADMASMASASASVLERHTVDILICVAHASLFTAAVAIAKDLPDMDGDRKFKIQTFALTYGWRAVGAVTVSLIALGIVVPMGLTLVYKPSLSGSVQSVYVAVAGVVIAELVRRARALKAPDATTLSAFYHGTIWPVFYANFAAVTVLQAASAGAFTQ